MAAEIEPQVVDTDIALYFVNRRFDSDTTGHAILMFLPAETGDPKQKRPAIHCGIPLDSPQRNEIARKHLAHYAETHDAYLGIANYAVAPTGRKGNTRTEAM